MTPGEATVLVACLQTAFPSNKLTDDGVAVWERWMQEIPFEICQRVINRIVNTSTFFPAWSEVYKACVAEIEGPQKTALSAWGEVGEAVRKYGRYQAPLFSDPLVASAVGSFGWQAICDSTNEVADRAHFVQEYLRLAEQREKELSRLSLTERAASTTVLQFPVPVQDPTARFAPDHRDFDESEAR